MELGPRFQQDSQRASLPPIETHAACKMALLHTIEFYPRTCRLIVCFGLLLSCNGGRITASYPLKKMDALRRKLLLLRRPTERPNHYDGSPAITTGAKMQTRRFTCAVRLRATCFESSKLNCGVQFGDTFASPLFGTQQDSAESPFSLLQIFLKWNQMEDWFAMQSVALQWPEQQQQSLVRPTTACQGNWLILSH